MMDSHPLGRIARKTLAALLAAGFLANCAAQSPAPPQPVAQPAPAATPAIVAASPASATPAAAETAPPIPAPAAAPLNKIKIVYQKQREVPQSKDFPRIENELWVINGDGSEHRRLVSFDRCAFSEPHAAPSGDSIIFAAGQCADPDQTGLYIVNKDGSNVRRLTSGRTELGKQPFSPDGTRVAALCCGINPSAGELLHIQTIDLATGDPVNVVENTRYAQPPSWLDDGTLVYTQYDEIPANLILTLRVAAQEDAQPAGISEGRLMAVSPDRQKLILEVESDAVQRGDAPPQPIGAYSFDTGTIKLIADEDFWSHVEWGPDADTVVATTVDSLVLITMNDRHQSELIGNEIGHGAPEFEFVPALNGVVYIGGTREAPELRFFDLTAEQHRLIAPLAPDDFNSAFAVLVD